MRTYKITYKTKDTFGEEIHQIILLKARDKHNAIIEFEDKIGGYFIEDIEEDG